VSDRTIGIFGDAITAPFWEAARKHQLLVQRCQVCGKHQFYPRPFCLTCGADRMEWTPAKGLATVYSLTTVRIAVIPDLEPPYVVALVALDEGPRMTTNIVGGACRIGDRVRVAWRDRTEMPPLPVFEPVGEGSK